MKIKLNFYLPVCLLTIMSFAQNSAFAQGRRGGGAQQQWAADGFHYYTIQNGDIFEMNSRDANQKTVLFTAANLTPAGKAALTIQNFNVATDEKKVLIY